MRLFVSVVTPSLMCGVGTWILTFEHEKQTRTVQRRMPRLIIQTKTRYNNKKTDYDEDLHDEERSEHVEENEIDLKDEHSSRSCEIGSECLDIPTVLIRTVHPQ